MPEKNLPEEEPKKNNGTGVTAFSKIKENIQLISAILSISAVAVSVITYLQVDRIRKMLVAIEPLQMEIILTEPEDKTTVYHHVMEVVGQVALKSTVRGSSIEDVNLELAKREIDITILVRPLSEANLWWTQTKPAIDKKGYFQGSINLGDKDGPGIGIEYQVVAIALPHNFASQGDTFRDLPTYGASSRIVTVKRQEEPRG